MKFKRVFVLVLDSVGIGALPDAADYGDTGANTIAHMAEAAGGIRLPNMESLGYGNLSDIQGVKPKVNPNAYQCKLKELSVGKDTMTGHWEIMGLHVTSPFNTFTDTGFPDALLEELSAKTGRGILGNKSASGTEILDELGEAQMRTGDLIVYTSADSVLQIAAHEEIIPLDELYRCCEIAREITMKEEWKVGRIIARPYVGSGKGHFKRTPNRHDYALKPFDKTVLDYLKEANYDVISIGKINDIFDGEGITRKQRTISNADGMEKTIETAQEDFTGLLFLNLVDFDAVYGHRRDPKGYAAAMEEFDGYLEKLMPHIGKEDLLMLTADHGNDPVHPGTDHTREYVPLLMYSPVLKKGSCLPEGESFANIGATIAQNFNVQMPDIGKSLMSYLQ